MARLASTQKVVDCLKSCSIPLPMRSVIEMIYDSFSMRTAGQKAKTVSKRKSQKPASAEQASDPTGCPGSVC